MEPVAQPAPRFPDQPLYVVVQHYLRTTSRQKLMAIAACVTAVTFGTAFAVIRYRRRKREAIKRDEAKDALMAVQRKSPKSLESSLSVKRVKEKAKTPKQKPPSASGSLQIPVKSSHGEVNLAYPPMLPAEPPPAPPTSHPPPAPPAQGTPQASNTKSSSSTATPQVPDISPAPPPVPPPPSANFVPLVLQRAPSTKPPNVGSGEKIKEEEKIGSGEKSKSLHGSGEKDLKTLTGSGEKIEKVEKVKKSPGKKSKSSTSKTGKKSAPASRIGRKR